MGGCAPADPIDDSASTAEERARVDQEVWSTARDILARDGAVRLLVQVGKASVPQMRRTQDADRSRLLSDRKVAIGKAADRLVGGLPAGAEAVKQFEQLPLVVIEVTDASALSVLPRVPGADAFFLDEAHERFLDHSLPLISQPEAQDAGFTGAGTAVAVLDTGLDYRHADFGSCTGVGTPRSCRVVANEEFAPDDGALDDHGHGTNVAAIVGGVAPGTDLIGMDVFRSDGYAYTSDIVSAIDWVVQNQSTYNIVALNMSLGGGQYTSECSTSAYEVAIATAEAAGVASAVATGNNGWTDSIASPACAPSAVKVGAVYTRSYGRMGWSTCTDASADADDVTCFSNSAAFIDLLAPGALITAGGYQMGGTSQATPHVAGALAVVAQAFPSESPADWTDRLVDTGTDVTDGRNGLTHPRIDVEAAILDAVDGEAPVVSITIEGGTEYVNERGVDVSLTVADGTQEATEMCLANAEDGVPDVCTNWAPLDTESRWWLAAGQGDKVVAVWVRDDEERTSVPATAEISLDTIAPTDGELLARWNSAGVALSWTAASDERSGVDEYMVVYAAGTTAPVDCSEGTVAYAGSARSTVVSGLEDTASYSFRVCAWDVASNLSVGAEEVLVASGEVYGTVLIDEGAEYATERYVTLALDAPGAVEMCLSNTPRCAEDGWRDYASELAWYLPAVEGFQRVSVWFRAADGTESEVATDDIELDRYAPEAGEVSASYNAFTRRSRVSWSDFMDDGSGIEAYQVMQVTGRSVDAACPVDALTVDANTDSATLDIRKAGPRVRVGVCAVDVAGHVSAPVIIAMK
jgi:subtilisin family serine protease